MFSVNNTFKAMIETRRLSIKGSTGISGELEAMIDDNQRLNNAGKMKVYGNVGSLQQTNSNAFNHRLKMGPKSL